MTETELLSFLGGLPNNDVNLHDLVEQIQSGVGIIPFVGAGLSAPYKFPQWATFLRELAKRALLVDEIEALLTALKYEEAAELLQKRMKSGFQDMVEHYFGDQVLKDVKFSGAVALVPHIATGPVITTNFDRLLENVFDDAGCRFPVAVWHDKSYAAVRALSRNRLLLLKLHGDWEFPGERVLTLSEYRKQYGSKKKIDFSLPLPETLELLVTHPLLFLGCSLKQDRTGRIIAALASRMPAMRHFAMMEYPDNEEDYIARNSELADMNVRPIWYPHTKHEKIEAVLAYLADFVPENLRLIKPARVVIPAATSTFVGRSRELEELKAAVLKYTLVTVTGAPGGGKTRLAQEVARSLKNRFDAIWFVPLSQLPDGAAIPQRMAHVMGIQGEPGRELIDVVVASLKKGRHLVLIDNCETALTACGAIVKKLREECPNLRLLLTSRVLLGAEIEPWKENEYRVPPLEVPDPENLPDLDTLAKIGSVALLLERAQPRSQNILTQETARDIAELCRRLDGIPLAIELIAAQMETRTVKTILEDWNRRLESRTKADTELQNESSSLRRAIDVSYALLENEPKGKRLCSLFRHLSVFHRGWTANAALQVCGEPGETEDELRDQMLAPMRRASLIETETGAGEMRYRYLDPIREFASSKLSPEDGADQFAVRHAKWAADFAQLWGPKLLTDQQSVALAKLVAEADNFRCAILWGKAHNEAETVLRLTIGLWRLMEIKGLYQDGSKRLRMALSLPGADTLFVLRSKALSGLSILAYRQGDLDTSQAYSQESLELERKYGDKAGIANALNDLGNVAQLRGEYDKAHDLYSQCLAIHRELNDARGIAVALFNRGRQATNLERFDDARSDLEESLRMFEASQNDREAAFALNGLAQLAVYAGAPGAAESYADRSLAIRERLGDKRGAADSMRVKADVFIRNGDFSKAADLLEKSGGAAIAMGDERGLAETLERLGSLNNARSDYRDSVVLYAAAEQLRRKLRLPISPVDRAARQIRLDAARDVLGQNVYDSQWREGEWMAPEDAFGLGTTRKLSAARGST